MSHSIALAEDNFINRKTFLQKMESCEGVQISFTSANGHECLEQLKGMQHLSLPALIFMDLEMPEMDGIETIAIAKTLYPHIYFIVLTVFDDDEKIFEAIKAGASGYLLKHEPVGVLCDAISNVTTYGGAPMSPAIVRKTMNILSRAGSDTATAAAMPGMITDREQEILQHMVKGWDAKRISIELNVSVLTIRKHIANIYQKLHVNSKAQVISLAHKNNWV